jgi:tetratricopeptide (TPR) repeat protein
MPDWGVAWFEDAAADLRQRIARGHIGRALELVELVHAVYRFWLAEGRSVPIRFSPEHSKVLTLLVDGVHAILDGRIAEGNTALETVYNQEDLLIEFRWLALLWLANAATEVGDLAQALRHARLALELAQDIDAVARSTSLTKLGELYLAAEHYERARSFVTQAINLFEEQSDEWGVASALMASARINDATGQFSLAHDEAERAHAIKPHWEAPLLFLSNHALVEENNAEKAEATIAPLFERSSVSQATSRMRYIIGLVKNNVVEIDVVREFQQLRDRPPSERVLVCIDDLVQRTPNFLPATELLAWHQLKAGRHGEALALFDELLRAELPSDIKSSVLLGLGLIAHRSKADRQTNVKVHAAMNAGRQALAQELHQHPPSAAQETEPQDDNGATASSYMPTDSQGPVSRSEDADVDFDIDIDIVEDEAQWLTGRFSSLKNYSGQAGFSGDLAHFAVPDLIQFLDRCRRTGTLVVSSVVGVGAIHFRNGKLTGGVSPDCKNIGDILVDMGTLTPAQLRHAARVQKDENPNTLLGAVIIDTTGIPIESVRNALRSQLQQAIREILSWSAGRFAFEPDFSDLNEDEFGIELDAQWVLLEAFRIMDESKRSS